MRRSNMSEPTKQAMTPAERLNQYIAEDRIIRGTWTGRDIMGRETACLLAAFAEGMDSPEKCPATIMPPWLAYLTPSFDDHGSIEKWPNMIRRYGALALKWHRLGDDAWNRCLAKTMIAVLEIARPYDRSRSCELVIELWKREYNGNFVQQSDWAEAAHVARAAWSAAWAAEAARAAA